ncbi:MAG: hypothetical protein ABI824_07505 [Acidobacteriota bacterium]
MPMSESSNINWVYFPKSSPPPAFGQLIVSLFESEAEAISSRSRPNQPSNTVMAKLRPGLEQIGFLVETSKSAEGKIVVPVLFGRKGKVLKCFNADAHAVSQGWVLEVEAGRAVDNNQFLKDIFQACMMHDVLHLAIAVRNSYRNSDDFAKVENFLETLYVSGRLQLPLKGILLIGY